MADPKVFSREHIEANKGEATEVVAEQAVHSLALVEGLVRAGLRFRFKGGNSLLLLLRTPRRFSMDVDIATAEDRGRIEACLDRAVEASEGFTRWARRKHKTKPWLPLASFEVYYDSHFVEPDAAFIFLDAQLQRTRYPGQRLPVRCGALFESEEKVEVATVGGILGDKILTLGPETLGIPLGKGKEAQRLKHVFDVSTLASNRPDLEEFRKSLRQCLEQENALQEQAVPVETVYRDTLAFCTLVGRLPSPPETAAPGSLLDETVRGLGPFRDHLFSKRYAWEDLRRDLARVALCFTAATRNAVTPETFLQALEAETTESTWAVVAEWLGEDLLAGA
ncbi:MAG: nucleotidyl transferase AbiEii/AbiGii toxin family protein [Planctomycetota bacterium]|jgi:hypothetical protein